MYSRLENLVNYEYVKGKKGKNKRTTGAHLVWLHGAIKKAHVVIIRKGWLSQQESVQTVS